MLTVASLLRYATQIVKIRFRSRWRGYRFHCRWSLLYQALQFRSFAVYSDRWPVFAGIATLCGLGLGFASVIETPADKTSVISSAEKLLHATLLLLFSSLLGIVAIELEASWTSPDSLAVFVTAALRTLGLFFLINAFWAAHYGVMWLSDVLWTRWKRRDNHNS
jgi:hypothetical protein